MAGSGGLRIGIRPEGFEAARRQLASQGRKVDPVLRGALDTTATDTRKQRYTPQIAPMFKSRSWVNKRIIIKRVNARKGRFDARLIPSSAGVYVTEYRRWGYQAITATRARILVGSFKGHKVAAGFVNPASFGRQPWATRSSVTRNVQKRGGQFSYKYGSGALTPALGPSVAWFFKRLTSVTTVRWVNRRLEQEFQRRMRRELLKPAL
ncbi:hypothetical protein [uncultured Stutzerimonas sp.]|uniref:hypothetical protein n=1 Tax=uncultured Stutzerimonas sp. TaxID=2901168 RepID=UPI0032B27F53|tara:strand:- start:1005 stop:1628 length:624 start_codon:yes stop_codon:yes gene_type:complete